MPGVAPIGQIVLDAIALRRSVRDFGADPVTQDEVRTLLNAAVLAPTAMHEEPWKFVIVQDREALRRYSEAAKAVLIQEAHVYRDLHNPSATPKDGGFLRELSRPDFNIFYNAGTLILICAHLNNPFVSADCWLAAENLMLAASGLGLGSCCIGASLAALNSTPIKTDLQIPADVSVVAAIVVGRPAEGDKAGVVSKRKPPVVLNWKRA